MRLIVLGGVRSHGVSSDSMLHPRLLGTLAVPLMLAHGQVPKDVTLSLIVKLLTPAGFLNADARNALIEESTLSPEQIMTVSHALGDAFELGNVEGNAASMKKNPGSDFAPIEFQRREILRIFAATLEQKLGVDGWAKFNSFLQSIEHQTRVHRSLCDSNMVVYTFGTVVRGNGALTAVAVADVGGYRAGDSRLYAEAALTSPENREVISKSPASSIRIHAAAVATLELVQEDGTYNSNFRFGEFCGGGAALRIFTDQPN